MRPLLRVAISSDSVVVEAPVPELPLDGSPLVGIGAMTAGRRCDVSWALRSTSEDTLCVVSRVFDLPTVAIHRVLPPVRVLMFHPGRKRVEHQRAELTWERHLARE